jgi:hypothetical protein
MSGTYFKEELTLMMAGGEELEELNHELAE